MTDSQKSTGKPYKKGCDKAAIITHNDNSKQSNLGDDIQAIAARRFLPGTAMVIEREKLNSCKENICTILNGWYMHHPEEFPPSETIVPLIITSIHISPNAATKMMNNKTIAYFKKYGPVGCRDHYTKNLLEKHGIDAYFSGCLTLTLNREDFINKETESRNGRKDVLISDVFFRYKPEGGRRDIAKYYYFNLVKRRRLLKKILPPEIGKKVKYVTNFLNAENVSFEERMTRAEELLTKYATAGLVVTSRLHTALPCLAFGTPVLFVTENPDDERFSGLLELLHVVSLNDIEKIKKRGVFELDGKTIDWNNLTNKNNHLKIRNELIKTVSEAVLKAF